MEVDLWSVVDVDVQEEHYMRLENCVLGFSNIFGDVYSCYGHHVLLVKLYAKSNIARIFDFRKNCESFVKSSNFDYIKIYLSSILSKCFLPNWPFFSEQYTISNTGEPCLFLSTPALAKHQNLIWMGVYFIYSNQASVAPFKK